MNKLEKFFTTLNTAQSKVLKKFTAEELASQVREYVDYTPFILKQVYKLLCSQASDDRKNGARILQSLMFQFRLVTNFRIEYSKGESIYLSSTGEQYAAAALSVQEQKRMVRKIARLEHVETNFLSDIDFKAAAEEKIKRFKVEDSPVENVADFFSAISSNLLSYEWYRRHGAFLAFSAMFAEETEGETQIKVDSSLFAKIYEILVSDKFNDFVGDRTVAPVRDAAAMLLGGIYPLLGPNNIIEELVKFLDSNDWQVQFSGLVALGHLKAYVGDRHALCTKLIGLFDSPDEDIKFLAAELLCYFPLEGLRDVVLEKCWESIESDEVIAVSKTSVLFLLTRIYREDPSLSISPENLKKIIPCFTSPVPEVRKSAVMMAGSFPDESLDFLLAELVLIEEKNEIRELAASVLLGRADVSGNLVMHFMNVIGGSLYEPYREEDFVSYDEHYFTKSGVKALGRDEILKNRCMLFMCLLRNLEVRMMREGRTLSDLSFLGLYKAVADANIEEDRMKEFFTRKIGHDELGSDVQPDGGEISREPGGGAGERPAARQGTVASEAHSQAEARLAGYFATMEDLKGVPIKEFKRKIATPEISSMHPMVDALYVDYVRMLGWTVFPKLERMTCSLYALETCKAAMDLFSQCIVLFYDAGRIEASGLIRSAYEGLVGGEEGFLSFFSAFGRRIFFDPFFAEIKGHERRLDFFARTIRIYTRDIAEDSRREEVIAELELTFSESLQKRNVEVLRGLMVFLRFNESFVRAMLGGLDVELLGAVLPAGDRSFSPLFVKPLLRKITSNEDRDAASALFSQLIPNLSFATNREISEDLLVLIDEERKSIDSLLDTRKLGEYRIKCPMAASLRDYQVEGIRWLAFLHSFNLNGILADDMGLGKTLQALTFLCSEIYGTSRKVLVVCPSSLTGHWKAEVGRFFPFIRACIYRRDAGEYDILIVSYETFRNDYLSFIGDDWFYVVADEGHVLRNRQTLLFNRLSMVKCHRRLIMTGTPVHNSVEDLVSLFHFLMPNYLGSEREISYYSVKMSDLEIERTRERLELLHTKTLPFVLRRLKIDVLKDLPPKIISDINIEFGPVQEELYREISSRSAAEEGDVLSYSRVNVRGAGFKRTRELMLAASHIGHFKKSKEVSCKVRALEDIISLCGGDDIRNKILVFFQSKASIDLVISDLSERHKFKYSRLDGSVPSASRSRVAEEFNNGPTQIMFLTTQVGGLGLNLTGADTVVFYEHDWNPFNDLQAMDRAHRIGQKKTVNVFRLIAKSSLEERVMNLQAFKMFVANSLVSQQNADIEAMDTKDLLERFQAGRGG
jgi:TATA-binding protein-associated factor